MSRRRQNWLTRLVKRILAWLARVFASSKRRNVTSDQSVEPSLAQTELIQSSLATKAIHQEADGNRNNLIGTVETGGNVYIDQSTQNYSPLQEVISSVFNTSRPQVNRWQGREAELAQLGRWLDDFAIRLISIVATGGYGKSALASKLYETAEGFEDKLWTYFDQPYRFGQWSRWLLAQSGQKFEEDLSDERLIVALVNHLSQKSYLLVLDNVETLLERETYWLPYAQFLQALCESSSASQVVITSRIRPGGLELYSEEINLKGLSVRAGTALLKALGVAGTDTDLQEFSKLTDGHPLLIRLTVGWLIRERGRSANIEYVLDREGMNLLDSVVGTHRGDPTASVSKVLEQSAALLRPELRTLWQDLGVYQLPFDLTQAMAMEPEASLVDLRELARYALLQENPTRESWRFSFLPLVKRFAQQQATDLSAAHKKAIAYFTSVAKPKPWNGLEDISAYLQIFHHHVELKEYGEAFNIIHGDRWAYLNKRGHFSLLIESYQKLLPIWIPGENEGCHSTALLVVGDGYRNLGDEETAMKYFLQALEITRRTGDKEDIAGALVNLGRNSDCMGDIEDAIRYNEEGLRLSEEVDNPRIQAYALNNLGIAHMDLENYEKAVDFFNRSIALRDDIGCSEDNDGAFINIGLVYSYTDRYPEAIQFLQRGVNLAKETKHRLFEANGTSNLGNVFRAMDDTEKAIAYYQQAMTIYQDIELTNHVIDSLKRIEETYREVGENQLAEDFHQRVLDLSAGA